MLLTSPWETRKAGGSFGSRRTKKEQRRLFMLLLSLPCKVRYRVAEPDHPANISSAENNGAYLQDCHVADPWTDTVKPWATDKVEAEKLWKLSEKLVGQEFNH